MKQFNPFTNNDRSLLRFEIHMKFDLLDQHVAESVPIFR